MMDADLSKIVDIRLLSVERVNEDIIDVQRELVFDDGKVIPGKHRFPADVLEWRAAEYGIDPADLDTLLDIVLWEPFLEEDDQPDLSLHMAPTIEEARTRHLDRVQKRKGRGGVAQRKGPDPVREQLKGMCWMHPEAVAIKQELTKQAREQFQKAREQEAKDRLRALVTPGKTPTDARLERLRSALASATPERSTRTKPRKESKNG